MKRADKQIGGFARAAALTPERRQEIAILAVKKRWENYAAIKKAGETPAIDGNASVKESMSDFVASLENESSPHPCIS